MYDKLKDMLHDELSRIQDEGELSETSLDHADKIVHTLKCLATYEAMERAERSREDRYRDDDRRRSDWRSRY